MDMVQEDDLQASNHNILLEEAAIMNNLGQSLKVFGILDRTKAGTYLIRLGGPT